MAKTAKPDGYTIPPLAISATRSWHMQKVDWDPIKDFTYIIGLTGYTPESWSSPTRDQA